MGPMSSYRDERDALRARLAGLEHELAELREGPDREEAKRRLAELSANVAEATVVTYKRDPILPIRLLGRRDAASFAKDSGAAWLFVIEGTAISLRIEDPTCEVTRL